MLIGGDVVSTVHKRILKAKEKFIPYEELVSYIDLLKLAEETSNINSLKEILEKTVEGFSPEKEIVDVLYLQRNK